MSDGHVAASNTNALASILYYMAKSATVCGDRCLSMYGNGDMVSYDVL